MSGKQIGIEAHRRRLARSDRENLELLARHYDLADLPAGTKWQALCIRLAQELGIPAFCTLPRKPGRKTRWTPKAQLNLYVAVKIWRALGMSRDQACEYLASGNWLTGNKQLAKNDASSIESRYKEALRHLKQRPDWSVVQNAVADLAREAKKYRDDPRAVRALAEVAVTRKGRKAVSRVRDLP